MKKYQELITVLEQATDREASFTRWLSSGITSVSSVLPRQNYWTDRHLKKGPIGKTYSSIKGVPIGKFLARLFKQDVFICVGKCKGNAACETQCHLKAANRALALINRDMSQTGMIKDPKQQARVQSKLRAQLEIYQQKKREIEATLL